MALPVGIIAAKTETQALDGFKVDMTEGMGKDTRRIFFIVEICRVGVLDRLVVLTRIEDTRLVGKKFLGVADIGNVFRIKAWAFNFPMEHGTDLAVSRQLGRVSTFIEQKIGRGLHPFKILGTLHLADRETRRLPVVKISPGVKKTGLAVAKVRCNQEVRIFSKGSCKLQARPSNQEFIRGKARSRLIRVGFPIWPKGWIPANTGSCRQRVIEKGIGIGLKEAS